MWNWVEKAALLVITVSGTEYTWQAGYLNYNLTEEAQYKPFVLQQSVLRTKICSLNSTFCTSEFTKLPLDDSDFFNALHNYGYNCFTEQMPSKLRSGKTTIFMGSNGGSIDEIDRACLEVHQAYHCMLLDYDQKNIIQGNSHDNNGNPVEGCFHGINFAYHVGADSEIICGPESNPRYIRTPWHGCRLAACEIEKRFAERVAHIIEHPVKFMIENYENYLYMSGEHPLLKSAAVGPHGEARMWRDDKRERIVSAADDLYKLLGLPKKIERCCGLHYPNKKPYNAMTHDCCDTGEVQATGRCGQ